KGSMVPLQHPAGEIPLSLVVCLLLVHHFGSRTVPGNPISLCVCCGFPRTDAEVVVRLEGMGLRHPAAGHVTGDAALRRVHWAAGPAGQCTPSHHAAKSWANSRDAMATMRSSTSGSSWAWAISKARSARWLRRRGSPRPLRWRLDSASGENNGEVAPAA